MISLFLLGRNFLVFVILIGLFSTTLLGCEHIHRSIVSADTDDSSSTADLQIIEKLMPADIGHEVYDSQVPREVTVIIIHSTYFVGEDPYDIDGIIAQYTEYGVATHYVIGPDGTVYRLVNDNDRAYHAGSGTMPDGRTGINDFSIGISLNNTDTVGPSEVQYDTLVQLILLLEEKYMIEQILGFNEVSDRFNTPWLFDWEKFREKLAEGRRTEVAIANGADDSP